MFSEMASMLKNFQNQEYQIFFMLQITLTLVSLKQSAVISNLRFITEYTISHNCRVSATGSWALWTMNN